MRSPECRKRNLLSPAGDFALLPAAAQIKILAENVSDISPRRIPYILFSLLFGVSTHFLALLSFLNPWRKTCRTLAQDPVFILGHWCSGARWLQQLLLQDDRFISPNRLECMRPYTSDIDSFFLRLFKRIKQMFGADAQDCSQTLCADEYALLAIGLPSPLRRAFFFRNYGDFSEHQGWEGLSRRKISGICRKWQRFLCRVQARAPENRMLLNSPQHSWRVPEIRKMFPNAKFILIVRPPEDVCAALIKRLQPWFLQHALSRSVPELRKEEFLENYLYMHDKLLSDLESAQENAFTIVRYEDLKADPVQEIRRIYQDLALPGGQSAAEKISTVLSLKAHLPFRPVPSGGFTFTGAKVSVFRIRLGLAPHHTAASHSV